MLAVTTTLLPMLYLTLELPKRIINDAIGAQSSIVEFWGFEFEQLTFLMILCGALGQCSYAQLNPDDRQPTHTN